MGLVIELPDSVVEAVADGVAARLEGYQSRRWFGVNEAAEYLATTPDAIRGLVKRGELVPTRRKPRLLFSREALDGWAMEAA